MRTGISGTVQGLGGQPLRGVCVTARRLGGTKARGIAGAVTEGLTDANGRYVIDDLRPGPYTVSYWDCADPGAYFEQWSGGAPQVSDARPVTVDPAMQVRLAIVRLRPTSEAAFIAAAAARLARAATVRGIAATSLAGISGTVTNQSGKRLAGICVWVYPPGNYFAGTGGTTRRNGTYDFAGMFVPGKYLVQFMTGCPNPGNYAPQYWKYAASPARAKVLRLRAGHTTSGVNARLGAGGVLSGTVRAAGTGKPLAGVCVYILSVDPSLLYQFQLVTGANGTYSGHGMATGRYQVQFQPDCGNTGNYLPLYPPGTVRVTAGKRTAVNAKLSAGAEISGVVTGPTATPLAGICVFDDSNVPATQTGADGSYSITRLGAGPQYLAFEGGCGAKGSYAPQYYPGQSNPAAMVPVTLSAGEVRTGVDASMSSGSEITGVVTNTRHQRLPGICVDVMTPSAMEPDNQNLFIPQNGEIPFVSTATTRAGDYRIGNLAPGLYYALFFPCAGSRYPPQWFDDQGAFGRASLISVGPGIATAGINAVLPPSGSISGAVIDHARRRLGAICVSAYNLAGQDWMTLLQAVTSRGTYKISGLPPGRYAVLFEECAVVGADAAQWYPAAASENAARSVLVRPGRDTKRINALLGGGGSVSGRVTNADTGKPVPFCDVVAARDPAGNLMGGAKVSGTGRYRIDHLLPGRYTLQACGFGLVSKANVLVRGSRTTTGVAIVLPDAGSLAGRVLDSTGAAPEAGVCVTAYPKAGAGVVGVTATGLDGRWTLKGVDPGSYRVLFSPDCMAGFPPVASQWFNDKASAASATSVKVASDRITAGINAKMAAPGSISGTVTNAAHAAVAGICVTAISKAAGSVPVVGVTASNGRFSIANLTPGKYLVRFDPGCGASGYVTQWYSAASHESAATPVTVVAGTDLTNINATMQR